MKSISTTPLTFAPAVSGSPSFMPTRLLRAVKSMRGCVAPYVTPGFSVPRGKYAGLEPSERKSAPLPKESPKLCVESRIASTSTNP